MGSCMLCSVCAIAVVQLVRRGRRYARRIPLSALPAVLKAGDAPHFAAGDEIGEADPPQKAENLLAQVFPQRMRQAGFAALAVAGALAAGGVQRFVDGADDLGDVYRVKLPGQLVSAAGPADAANQPRPAQLAETIVRGTPAKCAAVRRYRPSSPGPRPPCSARSSIAVTAYLPRVVNCTVASSWKIHCQPEMGASIQ